MSNARSTRHLRVEKMQTVSTRDVRFLRLHLRSLLYLAFHDSFPPVLTSVLIRLPERCLALQTTSHAYQSIVSYYARSVTIVFGQTTLVPTSEKSIAGCQKRRGHLYARNCKPGRESLTHTNTSKSHRLSISLYRAYTCSRTGSNVNWTRSNAPLSAARWIV